MRTRVVLERGARIAAVLACVVCVSSYANVVYVRAVASGANDGSSWANAYTSLRVALDTAQPGDELWVASGTYVPGPTATASDSFFLRSGVRLYGGFAGNETIRQARDWTAHPTILSGDVGQDDVPGNFVTANSAHVLTANGVDATCIVDGFVVTKGAYGPPGTPAGSYDLVGSGIFLVASSPVLRNVTFLENFGGFSHGAAMLALDSSPIVERCRFVSNYLHLGNGAAIYAGGASQPVIRDCEFQGNVSVHGGGGGQGQGGAIASLGTPPLTIERCIFDANEARQFYPGGGLEWARGGAIDVFGDGLVVRECVFTRNRANGGGAISVWGTATIVDCAFSDNEAISTDGPIGGGYGGAIYVWSGAGDVVQVVNCTITRNRARESAFYCTGAVPTLVRNSILWGNVGLDPTLPTRRVQIKGTATLRHSCVQALFQTIPGEDPPDPANYPGCIELDPLLLDPVGGDWRVSPASPCVDAGSNTYVLPWMSSDLDGRERVAPGSAGAAAFVDMGAYEREGAMLPTALCFGDDSGAACPCGNASPASSGAGCLNSLWTGGVLDWSGVPRLSADTLVLAGSAMPSSSALYFQGTSTPNGGAGVAFGDGLRCATGTIKRLGTKLNSAGSSAYPTSGDAPISVRGGCAPGAGYVYQVWYRNADAAFCTASTFNLTNALTATWAP